MKELFRERDSSRIGYYQSLLETSGIRTHVRNRDLGTTMGTEVAIPEFFPALCVVEDEDYDAAMEFLREVAQDGTPAPVEVPHQTKPIFVVGVCMICAAVIFGGGTMLFVDPAAGDQLENVLQRGFGCLMVIGGSAGIWRVLVSYRETKLREIG